MKIHYLIGDVLKPIKTPAIIPHICNNCGNWGSGFVVALSKIYPEPEHLYRGWADSCNMKLPLGHTQTVRVANDTWVVNMIAQHDVRTIDGIPPLRKEALKDCLGYVNTLAIEKGATIHAPRIGAVRSGGRWEDIEKIILSSLTMDTYIYTLDVEKDMWETEYENA
jgi:hypothetical protein